jgi:hypothetical protein
MTWRFRIQGVVLTIAILAALAMAAGANWTDASDTWFAGFGF